MQYITLEHVPLVQGPVQLCPYLVNPWVELVVPKLLDIRTTLPLSDLWNASQ